MRLRREGGEYRTDLLHLGRCRFSNATIALRLEQNGDEQITFVILRMEPTIEKVEHIQETGSGICSTAHPGLEPGSRPTCFSPVENGDDQPCFRSEILIKTCFGSPGFTQDRRNAHPIDTVASKKTVRCIQDS